MYKSIDEWNDYLTKNLGISYADFMDMFSENMDIAPRDLIRQIKEKTEIEDAIQEAAIQCYKYGYDNEDIDDDDYTILAEHFLAFKDPDISENDQWKNLLDEYFGDRDYE